MGLYEKIFNVMNESEGLEKNLVVGNERNNYKAVGEAEVLNMLKPLFKKYKLVIFPVNGEITESNSIWEADAYGKKETKTRNVTQLKVYYKIVDIETSEFEIIVGFGNGADSQDKGSGKAFTYSFKTALSKTFMLFSGEDTDNTHSDDIGKKETPKESATTGIAKCEDCQSEIKATDKSTVAELIKKGQQYHKKNLCSKCLGVRYRANKEEKK